jgi:hypothetical protein
MTPATGCFWGLLGLFTEPVEVNFAAEKTGQKRI